MIAYTASKGGLIALTRQLAGEWGVHGITVNAICPGFIPTKMSRGILGVIGERVIADTPVRRLGTDDDLKALVVLLSSEGARHISGQAIAVDGGLSAT